jgi:hypothetical protein
MTELEDDISADLEDEDPAEDDYPAENDLEEEPSLGSLGMGEWSDQTKWAAGNRTDLETRHRRYGRPARAGWLAKLAIGWVCLMRLIRTLWALQRLRWARSRSGSKLRSKSGR